jgi:hypothetical protein
VILQVPLFLILIISIPPSQSTLFLRLFARTAVPLRRTNRIGPGLLRRSKAMGGGNDHPSHFGTSELHVYAAMALGVSIANGLAET